MEYSRFASIKIVGKGMLMGIANIIPGVSGGTIAVVLGIYEQLIHAISAMTSFSGKKREHYSFLLPLLIGISISIFFLSSAIDYMYVNYSYQTLFFFVGLIVGSIPVIYSYHTDTRITFSNIFWIIMGICAVLLLLYVNPNGSETYSSNALLLLVAGIAASAAMVVPGFSGSFVLLVMGVYWQLIDAVETLNFTTLVPAGIGCAIGLIAVAKIIEKILKRHSAQFYSFILGLMIASVADIFPGMPDGAVPVLSSVGCCIIGVIISYNLAK